MIMLSTNSTVKVIREWLSADIWSELELPLLEECLRRVLLFVCGPIS